ncbi:nuclear transport factor 2 family protein [Methylobacterium sp. NEAU 140]|uniref:nuclear transport factor 2 family protein n=1 Tax=Methylobacterium sp. NEAU 140 TaxID=3064945 RepID=UPI0027345990|nr:nuclear transport factor 2 family protein [Methylobacterium sp. NEAU 140]MDP4022140.1 nuclear transport factor 2 family protein [Methylobacterium sp. NEAU 140]
MSSLAMSQPRRALLAAGLAAALVSGAAHAAGDAKGDAKAEVEAAVDSLTKAMLAADGPALNALTLDGLSYGHSGGKIEDKAAFVDAIASRRSAFPSITLSKQTVSVVGDDAIARHVFDGESTADGKTTPVHIGVMQVWHRDGGRWRLLARQAYKL